MLLIVTGQKADVWTSTRCRPSYNSVFACSAVLDNNESIHMTCKQLLTRASEINFDLQLLKLYRHHEEITMLCPLTNQRRPTCHTYCTVPELGSDREKANSVSQIFVICIAF